MKKIYSIFLIAMLAGFTSLKSEAATIIVQVEDFEFDPAIFTISTGDSIMWMWDNSGGQHTTTSTLIPQGAAAWDEVISNNSPMFIYVPTVAGSYDYICSYHSSMGMIGHFTVLSASPVIEVSKSAELMLTGIIAGDQSVTVHYNLPQNTDVNISLFDAIGNLVKVLSFEKQPAGYYKERFPVSELRSGMYILSLETPESKVTRRVFAQ